MTIDPAECIVNTCSDSCMWMEKCMGNDAAAYTYGILSEFVFFMANLLILMIDGMDAGTAFMLRGIASMLISIVIARVQNVSLHLNSHLFEIVTIRNIFVGFHLLMIFYCVGKLPFSLIYILEQTTPMWIFIINYFQYGLPIHLKDFIVFVASLLGVTMITFPDYFAKVFLTGKAEEIIEEEYQENNTYIQGSEKLIIIIIYSLSMISFSFGMLYVKKAKESLNIIQIIFNQGQQKQILGGLTFIYMVSGAGLAFTQKPPGESFELTMKCVLSGLIFIGILSYIYQIMYLRGTLITTNHGKYSMTGYSAVLFSYLYEVIFLHQIPDFIQILGVIIVVGSLLKL